MAHTPEYKCTRCERELPKVDLVVKRVEFREIGKGGRTIKSRAVAWLCNVPQPDGGYSCVELDTDWNRPQYSTAPGMAGTVLEEEHLDEDDRMLPLTEIADLDEHLREEGLRV